MIIVIIFNEYRQPLCAQSYHRTHGLQSAKRPWSDCRYRCPPYGSTCRSNDSGTVNTTSLPSVTYLSLCLSLYVSSWVGSLCISPSEYHSLYLYLYQLIFFFSHSRFLLFFSFSLHRISPMLVHLTSPSTLR